MCLHTLVQTKVVELVLVTVLHVLVIIAVCKILLYWEKVKHIGLHVLQVYLVHLLSSSFLKASHSPCFCQFTSRVIDESFMCFFLTKK